MNDTNRISGRNTLSVPVMLLLAALAVPRVLVHDLGLAGPGLLNAVLVFAPPLIWLAVVLRAGVVKPFTTLLVVGLIYGAFLAAGHQIFWQEAFGGNAPAPGGNLAGVLPVGAESVLLRCFAVVSSLVTGTLVGAVTGAVAWLLTGARRTTAHRW